MNVNDQKNQRVLEVILILITLALTALLLQTTGHRVIVLNLFYLPVVLAGFFLGRYRAGVLALLSVVVATLVVVTDMHGFAAMSSPIIVGLSITVWGAVLGLTALLVGTLCDDRSAKALEAREAHVGVVEVLARYLQSANPKLQSRALRISTLSEAVARKMRLSEKEIDDIRVAALLMDMENLQITARVIKKAVGELEDYDHSPHTFHGTELVQSLGSVLTGAFPLLLTHAGQPNGLAGDRIPFGARIIQTVRAYDHVAHGTYTGSAPSVKDALAELECDHDAEFHPAVLHALEEVLETHQSRLRISAPKCREEAELVRI
ncbi:MAG: HD-GYP domain-containing protein [Planctomycetaceae bacterium]